MSLVLIESNDVDDFNEKLAEIVKDAEGRKREVVEVSHSSALAKHEVGLVASFSAVVRVEPIKINLGDCD